MNSKQFMVETYPNGNGSAQGNFSLFSSIREDECISGKPDPFLKRNYQVEIGVVKQTSLFFRVKDNFTTVKQGGIFLDLPASIFNQSCFDQKISNSPALQAGEYELMSSFTEEILIKHANKLGIFMAFDLSQLHAICLGSKKDFWSTLNKEGVNYFLPLSSKYGTLLARINFYQKDGFLLQIDKPSKSFIWTSGILIARFQSLKDPYSPISLNF